eukprot:11933926-Heterocapsa_arctica.AAC.1
MWPCHCSAYSRRSYRLDPSRIMMLFTPHEVVAVSAALQPDCAASRSMRASGSGLAPRLACAAWR